MPGIFALDHPSFLQASATLSARSDRTWFLGLVVGLGLTMAAAFGPPGMGQVLVYLGLMIRLGLYLRAGSAYPDQGGKVLSALLGMGIVAGFLELIVDWVLVHGVSHGALVYLGPNDVVLLASPVWMPVAWACVVVELGYPSVRLHGLLRGQGVAGAGLIASIVIAISAGVTVGFYEYFAAKAGWWKYQPARVMLGDFCAWYIPLGEAFMFLAMLPIAARLLARPDRLRAATIESGALFAVAIAAGYALAYLLLEAGRPIS